ncbi:hypothetical protein A3K55_00765 [Candidatus Shapirobacteria bacterium RBG_13_44_7]|uniref:Uncharacterized protein n=1 Tax=Candidatus Shapirobacteria bacterium RBG_13_44_7 TaxID=1802149 RepID=A0A1F7SJ18_9BACT|nr:MAG: hypothetical protein A3K55_00765 [Candidatus Shapirobacteria bacterium RBG_13_44_7]
MFTSNTTYPPSFGIKSTPAIISPDTFAALTANCFASSGKSATSTFPPTEKLFLNSLLSVRLLFITPSTFSPSTSTL